MNSRYKRFESLLKELFIRFRAGLRSGKQMYLRVNYGLLTLLFFLSGMRSLGGSRKTCGSEEVTENNNLHLCVD